MNKNLFNPATFTQVPIPYIGVHFYNKVPGTKSVLKIGPGIDYVETVVIDFEACSSKFGI